MRHLAAALLLSLVAAAPASAAQKSHAAHDTDAGASSRNVMLPAMLWSLLPGGGHIYLGDTADGVTYAVLTAALLGAGAEVQRRNDELGRKDEVNVPDLAAEKVWEYSIFTTYRTAAARQGWDLRARRMDDTPTRELMLAPFDPDQLLRPAVFGAMLLGIADGVLGSSGGDGSLRHVSRVQMLGSDFNRSDATALYAVSDFSVSYGAGMAEEGLFRGILQPMLEERWGTTAGLWAAAGTFGAAHAIGLDGRPNIGGVLFATGAGGYLGWLYDHDDHRLAGPIAAHFWYDFMVFAAAWARDPDNTPFGFKVEFSY